MYYLQMDQQTENIKNTVTVSYEQGVTFSPTNEVSNETGSAFIA